MPIHAHAQLRRRLVLLGFVSVSMGCSLVDLCYLNPAPCAAGADGSLAEAGDASFCDAGSDPCTCLPTPKEFTGCGTVEVLLARTGYAYWIGTFAGSLQLCRAAPADKSGTVAPIYAFNHWTDFYGGFDVDSQYVYLGYTNPTPDSLVRGPLDGGGLAPLIPNLPSATFNLVARSDGLYWNDSSHDVCKSSLDGQMPVGDSGCGGDPFILAPDAAGTAPLSAASHNRDFLAVTDQTIYQTYYATGRTASIPLDGGALTILASGATLVTRPIAANDTDVVWSESSGTVYVIQRVAPTGGVVSPLTSAAVSHAFAIDDKFVYYAVGLQDAFRISKVPLAGGAAELVACVPPTLPSAPDNIAVDDGNVYFASSSDNRVFAVPK